MKFKLTALLVSVLTIGAASATFAGSDCCGAPAAKKAALNKEEAKPARLMLNSYERISNALAADDLKEAKAAARTFAALCDIAGNKGCDKSLRNFMEAEKIEEAREEFKAISAQAVKLAANEDGFYVMTCSMAGENADWVQSTKEIRNPYRGAEMLRCGSVKPAQQEAAAESAATRS